MRTNPFAGGAGLAAPINFGANTWAPSGPGAPTSWRQSYSKAPEMSGAELKNWSDHNILDVTPDQHPDSLGSIADRNRAANEAPATFDPVPTLAVPGSPEDSGQQAVIQGQTGAGGRRV